MPDKVLQGEGEGKRELGKKRCRKPEEK